MVLPENLPNILTLTTDWRNDDYYKGMLCGRLVSLSPALRVVEVTNRVAPFNLQHAAFVLRQSYRHFPEGAIHLCMVNSESCITPRMLVFHYGNHYFVLPDNGIIGMVFKDIAEKAYAFPFDSEGSFASLNAAVNAIGFILAGGQPERDVPLVADYHLLTPLRATNEESAITASVIYVDSYMNVITNVSREFFEKVGRGRRFDIFVQSQHNRIDRLVKTYSEVESGELLALFNSAGLLEVAISNGYAAQLLSLGVGSSVRIKFYD